MFGLLICNLRLTSFKLEREIQSGKQGLGLAISYTALQIIVLNVRNDILGYRPVGSYPPTFGTLSLQMTSGIPRPSVFPARACMETGRSLIILSSDTPAARFIVFRAFVFSTDNKSVVLSILVSSVIRVKRSMQVGGTEFSVFTQLEIQTDIEDPIVSIIISIYLYNW